VKIVFFLAFRLEICRVGYGQDKRIKAVTNIEKKLKKDVLFKTRCNDGT
jgi:hypothetical protein